jgi:hypothetical protein
MGMDKNLGRHRTRMAVARYENGEHSQGVRSILTETIIACFDQIGASAVSGARSRFVRHSLDRHFDLHRRLPVLILARAKLGRHSEIRPFLSPVLEKDRAGWRGGVRRQRC